MDENQKPFNPWPLIIVLIITLLLLLSVLFGIFNNAFDVIDNVLWYEIETDSTTARTMNDTNRGFVLYHLLPTGGYHKPRLNE